MRKLFAAVFALLLGATVAFAQETTTGSVEGKVVDAQGLGVPGVTITLTSDRGTKSTVSDDQGRFFAPFLTPGVYSVRAELQGFKSVEQSKVDVRLGQRASVEFHMQPGGFAETIQVEGNPPVVDTSSSSIGSNLDTSTLSKLPVGRTFAEALYLAPGVSSGGGTGTANPSVAGGSGLENQYIVDGVNISNSGYGALGSYSIIFGSLGTGVTYDFIQEIQVKTAGYEAEYGQSTGGVINVVTKSGSNLYRGSTFGYWRPEGLEGEFTPLPSQNAARPEYINTTGTNLSDVGVEASGPVLRNKLFFFGAVNPQWQRTTLIAPENLPLRSIGDQDQERRITAYSAKATYQLSSSHRIDASFFGDPSRGNLGPQRRTSLTRSTISAFSELDYGGHNQVVKYDGVLARNWLIEGSFARAYNAIFETPSGDEWNVADTTVTPNVRTGGVGLYEDNKGTNLQWQIKSTNIFEGGGNHQVRYGLVYEDIGYTNIINRTGPTFTLANGQQTVTGAEVNILPDPTFGRVYQVVRANLSNIRDTTQQYLSFFVQDTWRIGDRLTLRPGLRYEQQKLVGNGDDFKWDGNWAPRIGGVYDLTGTGRSKVYVNWGRFYAKIPNDLAARALSEDAGVTQADYFDANLTQPIPDGVLAAGGTQHLITAGTGLAAFDPNAKSTYLDETLVGFEFEAFRGVNLGARYIRRRFGRILEDVGTAPMASYFLPGGITSVEYFITNPDTSTPVDSAPPGFDVSFEPAIHDYDAVELLATKRFADKWALQASYRWSRLQGTFEGFFRNDNGQSDPGITSLFDFPTNDPSYTAIGVPQFGFRGDIRYLGELGAGPLPNDRPHQVKLFGNYVFDFGVNIGAGITLGSGAPLTPLAANPAYNSPGEIPEAPRGGGFETVDGFKERTSFESQFDLHADYAIRFGNRRIVLLADFFNLFDQQQVRDYDAYTQTNRRTLNVDFGRVLEYQIPRQVRLGARFEF